MCEHVYNNMNAKICPLCGKDTHEIDWAMQINLHQAHIAEVGLFNHKAVWWSI